MIEYLLTARELVLGRLALMLPPQMILLGKPCLECPAGHELGDFGFRRPAVTGMYANVFAEQLGNDRHKRVLSGHLERCKRRIGRLKTPFERRSVVAFKMRHLLLLVQRLVESIGLFGLSQAGRCQQRIGPCDGAVAF